MGDFIDGVLSIIKIVFVIWLAIFIMENFPLKGKIKCDSTVKYKGKKYSHTYYYNINGTLSNWQIYDEQHDVESFIKAKKFFIGYILNFKVYQNPIMQEHIRINTFTRSFKRNQCPMHGCKKDRSNAVIHKGRCKKIK